MKKAVKKILLSLTLVITVLAGGFLSQPIKGANPTFAEKFPDAQMALAVADFFGKNVTDEMDSAVLNATDISLYNLPITNVEGIGIFTNLSTLYLFDNQLTSLPDEIGNLTNLKTLYLFNNQLTSLPEGIGNF